MISPSLDGVDMPQVRKILAYGDEQVIFPGEPNRPESRIHQGQSFSEIMPDEPFLVLLS
jgi:hypothetical protein